MTERTMRVKEGLLAELKPVYRAQADTRGMWFVWRRVSATGWATHRACSNREEAIDLAARLNDRVELAGDAKPSA